MPTLRERLFSDFDLFIKSIGKLSKILENEGLTLAVRVHPKQTNKIINEISALDEAENQRIYIDRSEDIYCSLIEYDVLVTDYSSIYFDYLLLDRPIVFYNNDQQEYESNERSFYYDVDEVRPGPRLNNWFDIIDYIKGLKEGADTYKRKRKQLNKRFNSYSGSASEGIYNNIRRVLFL